MRSSSTFLGLATGAYGLIVVDPPWSFQTYSPKGHAKAPQRHYDCMPRGAIADLPVREIAAPDCWLALWAINPMIPDALDALRAWGFSYVSKREWVKRGTSGKLAFGTGHVVRGCSEPLLIAKCGNPPVCWRGMRSIFEAPRREHSRKPDLAYDELARFAGDVRKADLFARERRPGWDGWGDEYGKMRSAA